MKNITRRGIQIALGSLWLLDGALQLQHQMFTRNFATQVIAPVADGQPLVVRGPIHFAVHVILLHPAVFNACFALIQLAIGGCLLYKPALKYGLIGSVVWGLVVWSFGEAFGGLFSGHTLLLMGAPGAALLYVILSLAVLPARRPPAYWLVLVWAILWIGGGIYQLLPGQNSVSEVSSMIAANAPGAPGWLAANDLRVAGDINGFGTPVTSMAGQYMTTAQMADMDTQGNSGYWFILLLAAVQIGIGLGVLYGNSVRKLAIGTGIVLSLGFWVFGQSLGEYFTGLATDPSTGPLFVLLGVSILGYPQLDQRLAVLYRRIEKTLT